MPAYRVTPDGWLVRLLSAVCLSWIATAAQAHVKSESHSVWRIDGATVNLDYSVPLTETVRLATTGGVQPPDDRLLDYFKAHLSVSAKGGDCRLTKSRAVRATDQFRRFEFAFQCPSAQDVQLHSSTFFDLIASHTHRQRCGRVSTPQRRRRAPLSRRRDRRGAESAARRSRVCA